MLRIKPQYRVVGLSGIIVMVMLLLVCSAQAAPSSALSRWLSDTTIPAISEQLRRHPRFAGAGVAVIAVGPDKLSAAIAQVLQHNLADLPQFMAGTQGQALLPVGPGATIDALDCADAGLPDYQLQVRLAPGSGSQRQLDLNLTDAVSGATVSSWRWQGSLSRDERDYARQQTELLGNGTLAAPWQPAQVQQAAAALSYQLLCELRPQVAATLLLDSSADAGQWAQLTPTARQTFAASTQLLAGFRELEVSSSAAANADYRLALTLVPFSADTWQLWLEAAPRTAHSRRAQAVAYVQRVDADETAVSPTAETPAIVPQQVAALIPALKPAGDPADFLDVALIETAQQDRRGARADLLLTLELRNRAPAPLAYSLTTSGGHFNHCVARPGNYRHDAYGTVAGVIAPGATILRRMRISDARHRPTPLLGARSCAGFRDLRGFEQYSSYGSDVTDYVRWKD